MVRRKIGTDPVNSYKDFTRLECAKDAVHGMANCVPLRRSVDKTNHHHVEAEMLSEPQVSGQDSTGAVITPYQHQKRQMLFSERRLC